MDELEKTHIALISHRNKRFNRRCANCEHLKLYKNSLDIYICKAKNKVFLESKSVFKTKRIFCSHFCVRIYL